MADYELMKRAQRDLVDALYFTAKTFGPAQVVVIAGELRADLETLADVPNPGTPRRTRRGVYWLPSGSYILFYRVRPRLKRAVVIRILHKSRLPALHLL